MKRIKQRVHFVDPYLLDPQHPVIVNVIGTGGTGSQVLAALTRIHRSLLALGHPGLFVQAFDEDIVTEANLGRQGFADADIGINKAVILINRINRAFGSNWKAVPLYFSRDSLDGTYTADIAISCVDTVAARMDIADILKAQPGPDPYRNHTRYWLDMGNSRYTGQVHLATVRTIEQPKSKKYKPVASLPYITDEFRDLLLQSETADTGPSCSLAEALEKQDLFINPALANLGASLLWSMFREGMLLHRGFFLNLKDFRSQPLKLPDGHTTTPHTRRSRVQTPRRLGRTA